ncbi:unnamed protein product [Blepharisma stoltei]|uniref:Uncharacterized protein n=1 Tax=Blepharisma stoltei TaxID=1481888 RepID=A0AAU9J8G3_9CILI|nr:unnamed protein product [Blepharisma stoltei]
MEELEKEHKKATEIPLFSIRRKEKATIFSLNLSKISWFIIFPMFGFIYANIAFACLTNFSCLQFLPTPLYLGCFRGHDRLFIVACTYFAAILVLLNLSTYSYFKAKVSPVTRKGLFILGFSLSVVLALIGLTDEATGAHTIPLEEINYYLVLYFKIGSLIWIGQVYYSFRKNQDLLNPNSKSWLRKFETFLAIFGILALSIIFEQSYLSFDSELSLVSENIEALLEWVFLGLITLMPAVIMQIFKGHVLEFAIDKSQDTEGVELKRMENP